MPATFWQLKMERQVSASGMYAKYISIKTVLDTYAEYARSCATVRLEQEMHHWKPTAHAVIIMVSTTSADTVRPRK